MNDTRLIAMIAAVTVVVIGGWIGYADKQLAIQSELESADRQLTACSIDRALAAGLRNYVPNHDLDPAPTATFYDADDQPVTLAEFRGTGVVLNFWATWCAPCVEEMPALDRLDVELKKSNALVIAVSEDREPQLTSPDFYAELGLTSLGMWSDRQMKFSRAAKVSGLPTTLLINQEGQEVAAVLGAIDWDDPDIVEFVRGCVTPG